ncbi:hypothetical protein [Halopelagius fulvigenes]|uniref:Uncharacterized protein n=1 Tax=Halopelagius fulvigenes TaxID=1198324 RepID=A0ABD5U6A0_9EURY
MMNANWDEITWVTETVPEENEVRVRIEGKISDVDGRTFERIRENDVEVRRVTIKPE